ncbi:ABC transporter substrate-binding protein [Nesterenkonia muleiensis]|uniref:ABC transporter substrate-binding protein n=1 Tax=Nesterenkonia muleiensis TaxID=2282648 RepID=UPI001300895D|nr:NrtA/SsuA/CpmA family ABC transporter substrate-binding protein [Nesterenkonia muleiensis]
MTAIHAPVNYEPLYIAEQHGYFDDAGLEVTITAGGTPQDNLAQIMGGSADLTITSWDVLVSSTAEQIPALAVASNSVVSNSVDTSGLVVRTDSGITDVEDLTGRTVAFNDIGGGPHVVTMQAFRDAGLSEDQFEAVRIPFASMQAALESGQVDAAFPSDSFYRQVAEHENFQVIANPTREYRAGLPITLWAATETWLQENADIAERFTHAMDSAIEFYEDESNAEAVSAIREEVTGEAQTNSEAPQGEFNTAIDLEVSQSVTDALVEFGIVEDAQNVKTADEIVWERATTQ